MRLAQSILRRGSALRWTASRVGRSATAVPLAESSSSSSSHRVGGIVPAPIVRSFSSEAQTSLVDILNREYQEEVETGNLELPQELADLKASLETDWKIVVDDDAATTQLFWKSKKVQVSFHCQDSVEDFDNLDMEELEEGEAEEGDDEEEPVDAIRFCVTLSKAGKTLVYNCLSEFGQVKIESVATTTTAPEAIHANQGTLDKAEYQGPDFMEMAEDLQEAMGVFLEEECGVNSDVATFVAMYTDYKEQLKYAQFLKDAQSIIS